MSEDTEPTNEEKAYAEHAAKNLHRDGELEFDDVPKVSISEDGGAYVQAWVWIDREDVAALQTPEISE